MFDFVSDPGFQARISVLVVVALANALFWESGRPRLTKER
jgi:hypothetical protein